jgi:hypothetical protein
MSMQASAMASGQRPVAITVICVLSAIGIVLSIPVLFTDVAWQIAAWYPIYIGISAIIGAVCTYGLWTMKKWALYLYTALFVLNQIILLMLGVWSIIALIIPLIVVAICWAYQARMT